MAEASLVLVWLNTALQLSTCYKISVYLRFPPFENIRQSKTPTSYSINVHKTNLTNINYERETQNQRSTTSIVLISESLTKGLTNSYPVDTVGMDDDKVSMSAILAPKLPFFLISTTFLWELECNDETKVGLAAGRYSGKRRPDLKRTPHALQRVFGPIGPSLHCGVFVTSQCIHFLVATGSSEEKFPISVAPESTDRFFFFLIFFFEGFDAVSERSEVSEPDSKAAEGWDILEAEEVEQKKGTLNWLLDFDGRGRLFLARFTGMVVLGSTVVEFSTEQELLLSRTETGLEVWKRRKPLTSEDLWRRALLLEVASTVTGSPFSGEFSSC